MADKKPDPLNAASDAAPSSPQHAEGPAPGADATTVSDGTAKSVPDPYAAHPEPKLVPHEGIEKDGVIPIPKGHQINPPGAIPRSPGEWPSGAHPPENPLGKVTVGKDRPASDPNPELSKKIAAKQEEAAEDGKKPGVVPGSEEDKKIRAAAEKEVAADKAKK